MFQLLGPVEWTVRGHAADLGSAKQRTVLAALLVDAGRLVPWPTLIDRVWDQAPATDARGVLYTYVNRIRRILEQARTSGDLTRRTVALTRRTGGYALEMEPDLVDLHRFRALVMTAYDQRLPDDERSELLREALALWDGPALADLPGTWAARMRETWSRQRLDAAVQWGRAELRLGRPEEVIGPAGELAAGYPFAEPLAGVLIRALAAAGRHAEALDTYAGVRAHLVDKLGAEPGPELREIHQAILRGSPSAGTRRPREARAARPVPAQLPAEVPAFVGRESELAALTALSRPARPPVMGVVVVSGTAGVGKSALVVRWAHRARADFPDGQLYVNLRGYDPRRPVPAADALAGLLAALGVPAPDAPADTDERSARYRTEISGRRMLVVLDNASSVEHVRPLLPGTPSCVVVVTSRDSLAGLVALHGARRLDLDLLPAPDASALLRALVGGRVEQEPGAAAALARQCARLPLALRIAAELASARPASPLSELVAELADQRRRLDLLDAGGDPRAAVRAVFSWSYRRLPADAARAFRLLGLHPGPDLDPGAAAALIGVPPDDARRLLGLLAHAHLIGPARAAGHGMHDLLRAYATDLAHTEDSEADRQAARRRLADHYRDDAGWLAFGV
ncbi:AfsR/SARP family transcriptional regulator [Sphaerisporangium corydalis]|uniref:BTAD domain-containing putative transcriptional regulator n=1 Tax=Sphaerisporangium corydalis TaxID=1441875 RepID=A0ABV9EHR6_9ACTN|nr:BTAD domain-containing putative transcriptional regulator [Sphaerisporangium corydalis]